MKQDARVFLAAIQQMAEFGGFPRATAHMGVSTSALGWTVRQRLDTLGAQLFRSATRWVDPTGAGGPGP